MYIMVFYFFLILAVSWYITVFSFICMIGPYRFVAYSTVLLFKYSKLYFLNVPLH